MMNCILIQGRLTDDPLLRRTQAGVATVSFTVAYNDRNEAHYFDCVAWDNTATMICDHFRKGKELLLRGRLQTRAWKTQDGFTRRKVEINVQEVAFCGKKDDAQPRAGTVTAPSVSISSEDDFEEIVGVNEFG